MGHALFISSFNPHPSRRTGATRGYLPLSGALDGFNPHPSRRTGATPCRSSMVAAHAEFQSSPVPKDGCNLGLTGLWSGSCSFNPHPSRRTGATPGPHKGRPGFAVSILTRPEGRVQLVYNGDAGTAQVFQSSPVPKDGCNYRARRFGAAYLRFNPHPSRRTGATKRARVVRPYRHVSILTRPEGRVQRFTGVMKLILDPFQSSPVPKDGCNATTLAMPRSNDGFQSSPVPKDGCNQCGAAVQLHRPRVSILTRPEGRVQRQSVTLNVSLVDDVFQSSPVPKDGCNHPSYVAAARPHWRFQSSPVPKDGCNQSSCGCETVCACFNPHPSRRTGATWSASSPLRPANVSILTRPEGRVQRRTTAPNSTLQSNFPAPLPC